MKFSSTHQLDWCNFEFLKALDQDPFFIFYLGLILNKILFVAIEYLVWWLPLCYHNWSLVGILFLKDRVFFQTVKLLFDFSSSSIFLVLLAGQFNDFKLFICRLNFNHFSHISGDLIDIISWVDQVILIAMAINIWHISSLKDGDDSILDLPFTFFLFFIEDFIVMI